MRILSIDTASHEGHIACMEDAAMRAIRVTGRISDTELIPLLQSVLDEADWKPADIERIACNLGPGGFTSVRTGVAFANALADQLQVPVAGYHGSALSLTRADAKYWIHSTRKDQCFVLGGEWHEPTLVSLLDLLAAVNNETTIAGDLMDEHRIELQKKGATFPVLAPLEQILPAFLAEQTYSKNVLIPWYGRGI